MITAKDVIALTRYPSAEHPKYGKTFSIIGEDRADAILAALEEAGISFIQWQPIETALKDGTKVLLTYLGEPERLNNRVVQCRWTKHSYDEKQSHWDDWPNEAYRLPTHWSLLPKPPRREP